MTYDSDLREADVTALDTATPLTALGASTPGNFIVPGSAKYISEIRISASPDFTADQGNGFISAIRLNPGGGIKAGGELSFGGPCGLTFGAAATSAGQGPTAQEIYQVYIPVVGGGEFSIDGFMLGEDAGSLRIMVTVIYDGPLSAFPIKDADYRESDLTTANALVRLTSRHGAAVQSLRPTTDRIGEIRINAGLKPVAGPLAATVHVNLYGAALASGGNYNFAGPGFFTQDDSAISGNGEVYPAVVYKMGRNFAVKMGSNFDIQAQEVEDDVGTLYGIVTICYV